MRRTEREVIDPTEIENILSDSEVVHLGINDDDFPYVVPTNYGYEFEDDRLTTLYLHGAPTGKKWDLISQNGNVGFQIDDGGHVMVTESENPSRNSMAYRSIIGVGHAATVDDTELKKHALQQLLIHETGHAWNGIREHDIEYVGIIKIDVLRYTAKAHYDEQSAPED